MCNYIFVVVFVCVCVCVYECVAECTAVFVNVERFGHRR